MCRPRSHSYPHDQSRFCPPTRVLDVRLPFTAHSHLQAELEFFLGFPVPTNVSMLPNEAAVVNRLEFVWEGGSFLCTAPAVSNIGSEFYALICQSGSDVLAAGRGKVISLVASVEYGISRSSLQV